MKILRTGMEGPEVKKWEVFLVGQKFDPGAVDGKFTAETQQATTLFQQKYHLDADGMVGNQTWGQAMMLGLGALSDPANTEKSGPNFPPPPGFAPLRGTATLQKMFGKYEYKPKPVAGNKENITILGDWESRNIVKVEIPQLMGIKGAPASGNVRFHRLGAKQFVELWAAWEQAKLLDRILTWDGSYNPRFQRGSKTALSNHAFGSAFDINAALNALGVIPALVGRKGCVRELVTIANEHGFYWGGHFKSRPDGMHFEIAVLK